MTASTPEPDPSQTAWVPPEGSWASSAARRRNMQAIRSRDTTPERLVRRLVHAQGLRYRVAARPLSGLRRTADMVFRPAKVAVFIDGCYWHGCPEHYVSPKTNPGYWSDKVARNMARDRDTDERLREAGWLVLRFWEHQSAEECSEAIRQAVMSRRPPSPASKANAPTEQETS
ncbi:very short patch repair endonuclease [Streptomyces sp. NPDC006393]|uniref:very short patch repair endonuclease n=1 Tax=Streptomyces sp. NPDC006393 TaxID=3156763 RepID=UPI0033E3F7CD